MNNFGITFDKLTDKINALGDIPTVDASIIGSSVLGEPIRAFHVGGYEGSQIIVTGAIHAREWITALLVAELVNIYSDFPLGMCGIFFIPLCNPDGVKIALEKNPLWKANARGVDLNVNFDADWGCGIQNVRHSGAENFIGPHPNSEPETVALVEFTAKIKPQITIAYHSKGEVVYYGFKPIGKKTPRSHARHTLKLTKKVCKITGYAPIKTRNSTGGYSDWVSMNFGIPALTIEVGKDEYTHPIGTDKLTEILHQNKDVLSMLIRTLTNSRVLV